MDKWKNIQLSKEEEEAVTLVVDEVYGEEIFQRILAGKLWTDNNFNARAFMTTIISAWKLKKSYRTQEMSKNLFLFIFATRTQRGMEYVLRSGPWSFDRNLLILSHVFGEEQSSDLNMHYGVFWVMIYDLLMMLRSETMARKLGGILGTFEELDQKEAHRNNRWISNNL
ncbi:unnamed protein product [Lathyrus sativus]|nr:unnamed protein product [Lathyrus sativus]